MKQDLAEKPLTKVQQKLFADCETDIERHLASFVIVGQRLAAIRDGRLYRSSHKTFEEYCRVRWDFTRVQACRLIGGAEIVEHLETLPIGNVLPSAESQVRPLLRFSSPDPENKSKRVIDMKEVDAVWQEVVDRAPKDEKTGQPKITGKHVAATVKWWETPEDDHVDTSVDDGFDYEEASLSVFRWGRDTIREWPEEYREALSQTFQQLSEEALG